MRDGAWTRSTRAPQAQQYGSPNQAQPQGQTWCAGIGRYFREALNAYSMSRASSTATVIVVSPVALATS